ncbi:MAG: redoxin family protein [Pyrinomonadaceae bacterium MAG19_C2-C3]|nr:redoxin family protein [Pyrinomonadaceae bacterium MAG19_C2-C3]
MTRDNDGKEEKGALRVDQTSLMNREGFSFSGYERDPLYLNLQSEGVKKFLDISGISGIDSISDGRAGVFADFDNDGDLDVFMTTIQGQSHLLFRNNVGQENNSLRVMLEGDAKIGRDAFSSVVRVVTSAGTLTKIKDGGSGFISEHDPRLLFGLKRDAAVKDIEVTWSNGQVETFNGEIRAGQTVLLRKGTKRIETVAVKRAKLPDPLTRAETFARGLKIAVGKPLPDVNIKTIDGKPAMLKNQIRAGRQTLFNVWATWCVPCAQEMPELERLRPALAREGIDLVGLNVDSDPTADVRGFLKDNPVKYTILVGGVGLIESLYATDQLSVPLSVLVDERGIVTEIIPGWSNETRARFDRLAGIKDAAPRKANRTMGKRSR